MALASYIKKYFWEIDAKKAQPKAHPEYYIKRILELGDKKAFLWLKKVFGEEKIRKVARKTRLSAKAKTYWRLVFP